MSKERFERIKKSWEEYNSNENVLYGFADLISNEDFEFLIKSHETLVNGMVSAMDTMNGMEEDYNRLTKQYHAMVKTMHKIEFICQRAKKHNVEEKDIGDILELLKGG